MSDAAAAASRFAEGVDPAEIGRFAADVEYYLMQEPRQLPSRYLYDPLGSALFEAICHLPWYRITRAEERLLAAHGAEVLRHVAPLSAIVELGSGSGEKLRILLGQCGADAPAPDVHLVDVSAAALESSARAVKWTTGMDVTTHRAPYEEGLRDIGACLDAPGRILVLFLGSNIGNYDPPSASAFVRGIRGQLRPGDALLMGADLVKPERDLLLAYDDPLGVTAAFNRNLLVRINRELGGDFDVARFAHVAVWNAGESRIEMHLVSARAQEIRVREANLSFSMEAGERIWTESSYKYRLDDIIGLLEPAGFRVSLQWVDTVDCFAVTLAEAM